jgi:hypothetical protein
VVVWFVAVIGVGLGDEVVVWLGAGEWRGKIGCCEGVFEVAASGEVLGGGET